MASPNKIKNVGYDYKPFQMKAAGPKYKNSPIEKNYGSPAQRGFDFTGGVGSKEMESGVGSAFDYASPAKGWLSNMRDKLVGGARKAKEKMQGVGRNMLGIKNQGGAVAPHGDEMHNGGGDAANVMASADKQGWGGIGDTTDEMTAQQAGTEEDPTKPVDPRKAMGSWGGLSSMF